MWPPAEGRGKGTYCTRKSCIPVVWREHTNKQVLRFGFTFTTVSIFRLDCQGLHGQPPPLLSCSPCISPSAALTLSCCRQTINQCFASWTAHIYCSCLGQQKSGINKDKANPLNWQLCGWTEWMNDNSHFCDFSFLVAFHRQHEGTADYCTALGVSTQNHSSFSLERFWTSHNIILNRLKMLLCLHLLRAIWGSVLTPLQYVMRRPRSQNTDPTIGRWVLFALVLMDAC